MALRTVAAWESSYDQHKLWENNYQLQFAKSVIGKDGQVTFNLVWQSENLAPRTTISWEPVYGLNWTLSVPANGVTVTIGGAWQICAAGQSYDIEPDGNWAASSGASKPGFLEVGTNKYQYAQQGLHILVGVQNAAGGFDPIYIDPNVLPLNNSAWYQPKEEVQWWYQAGNLSSTMISGQSTPVQTYDMSAPNPSTKQYYVSTTYSWDAGAWTTSQSPPPPAVVTGFAKDDNFIDGLQKGQDLQRLRQDISTIVDTIGFLATLLINQSQGSSSNVGNPFAFLGRVKWPGTASVTVITAGITIISTTLLNKGYQIKVTRDDQGKTATFELNPPKSLAAAVSSSLGVVPPQVVSDWNTAVATDSKDGAANQGIGPDTNSMAADVNPQKKLGYQGNQTDNHWNGITA